MSIALNANIMRVQNIISAPVDDEIVILNLAGNNYLSLNSVGRRIWELLEKAMTAQEICDYLCNEFDGDGEQIRSDVLMFLEELEQDGLIDVTIQNPE
jgi:DNA-directed RNA polymerase delta subunit